MKRTSFAAEGGEEKRSRNAPNPYLQYSSRDKRENVSFSKRQRHNQRALFFDPPAPQQVMEDMPPPTLVAESELPVQPNHHNDPFRRLGKPEQHPAMEWWDLPFLPKDLQKSSSITLDMYDLLKPTHQKTIVYVEHPVSIAPTKQSLDSDEPLKLYQTKQELKRIRRKNRELLTQEKRDKIAIGLIPPPPPRVKLSNLLRVLANDQTADPSRIEANVREQMEQRELQHLARNLAKKLTPKERADKIRMRIQKDALMPNGVNVAVFALYRVEYDQDNEIVRRRFSKVFLNAKKYMLSGRLIKTDQAEMPILVLVEGGPKSVRKFIRFMTEKMDWKAKTQLESELAKLDHEEGSSESESDAQDGDDYDQDANSNKCKLLWRGLQTKREFEGFKSEKMESALDVRQFLEPRTWRISGKWR